MTARYLNAAGLPGVLTDVPLRCEHRKACWSGDDWYDAVYCDGALLHENGDVSDPADYLIRLDTHRPEVAHHLCLTWGPLVDGRWHAHYDKENEDWVVVGVDPDAGTADEAMLDACQPGYYYREGCESETDAQWRAEYEREQWWLALLNNPAALHAECLLVAKDKTDA